jgi:DNA polymerase-1
MRTSKGLSTEAVYIFHNMLRKLRTTYNPEYIAAIFESLGPTFREQSFAEYKANRAEAPADLGEQIPYISKILEAMRIPILQFAGFEADDVIGTIAREATQDDRVDVVIVSSDKDMLQLVTDRVSMYNPAKDDTWYDPNKVLDFMGVPPSGVADLLALKGDAIDNIPGAPGIGDKGARDLILRFGSVENAIEHAREVEKKTYRESLLNHRDQILLSKKLATIDCSVPVQWSLDSLEARDIDTTTLRQLYRELEFFSLLKELGPTESLEGKDYRQLTSTVEVTSYLNEIPAGVPVSVAVADSQIGLAYQPGQARAIPEECWSLLKPLLEDAKRPKITHDAKTASLILGRHGIDAKGFGEDILLHAFLLSADPAGSACEVLAEKYLDRKLTEQVELRADCALELYLKLHGEVHERGLRKVYDEIDLPLTRVLAKMEHTGIRIEPEQLALLSERMDTEIQRLSHEIYDLAGGEFNINSPQQLGKVLYEDLKLPAPVKYGKGKSLSTAADILEVLAVDHPIARLVLEYRQLTKLKGTYVDALPALIREDGRVHTTYNQAGAATGRLSSSNPNLQNIPIRTELGREIRAAFVPEPGWDLLVADYSQIELRLLAHMSGDPVLLRAFRNGEDIHTRTAAEVFGVMPEMVTSDMRRNAKAVNFGIVYGQTPWGLAAQLGIGRKEAETYIRSYFELYQGVKEFIDRTIAEVRTTGVAKTLFGRERPIPDMNSRNPSLRSFAERTAVNTPLQGTAADLIKIAMIRIDRELEAAGFRSRMLLQVHDELLLEAPPAESDAVKSLVKREMENVWTLDVPLIVDVGAGTNWRDAKE